MKFRFFLTSVFLMFGGLIGHAQVSEMLYQGFETGETVLYSVTPSTASSLATNYQASGARSIQLIQQTNSEVTLLLDTIDFTQNLTLSYISLYFDHVCDVYPNIGGGENRMCRIYFKRANETESQWHVAQSQHYNTTNGGSSDFGQIEAFSDQSYSDWEMGNTGNDTWKSERFDFNTVFNNVPQNERKLQIKFVLTRRSTSAATGSWWIDNIKIHASPSLMVRPNIKMAAYPDAYYYANSRGAKILLDATTTVASGINPDSVYLMYRVGSNPTPIRLQMTHLTGSRYSATIPFEGFDTLMSFYCVARDATTNANKVTFPLEDNSWVDFVYVRGQARAATPTPQGFVGTGTTTTNYPFPTKADNRSQFIYDSALMAESGYGPGALTSFRMTFGAHTYAVDRQRVQISLKNIPTSYHPDTTVAQYYPYDNSYMRVVYDSALHINESNANGVQTIQFQDSFFYAGKDLMMQFIYHNPTNVTSTSVRTIPMAPGKPTLWAAQANADDARNYFNGAEWDYCNDLDYRRPAFVFTEVAHQPLLRDAGISELVSPSYETPMSNRPGSLTVKLKNFGALAFNAIRISYNIDDTIFGHYDWSGTLAPSATQNVTISSNINIPAGYHTLKVWVEDTLTASGVQYRDHEPYNDTAFSQFIVCDGPLSGVRQVGGAGADYNDIEELLFSLSRCGIDDSLVVKVAPGSYPPFVMPAISGITASHYIVFEPLNSGRVTFYSDGYSTESIVDLESISNVRFRDINFVRRSAVALTYMAKLGISSSNCHFEGCTFVDSVANPAASLRINAMIYSGFANGMVVDGCTFTGGKVGVDVQGQAADLTANNNTIKNSIFYDQNDNAINAQNQTNLIIHRNEMYDVFNNASYVLLLNECFGSSQVTANKIYTTHGAGALGVSGATGSATTHFVIANNMAVCNDDGTANLMRSAFNIITANWADVVYNSVKMTAPTRTNIPAATFGGGTLTNSRFVNNIVVCLDNTNYALGYLPGSAITNVVGHNVYFSRGSVLNRKSGAAYANLTQWQVTEPDDTVSISVNPNFLNGSSVDLRTYNRLIKGVGMPLSNVTVDMFDTIRGTTATCPGAFEFTSLAYDFEPEALISPELATCYMPSQVELVVLIRNSGVNPYPGTGLTISYKLNNGATQTVNVTGAIPAEDTVSIHTGAYLSLPANGIRDSVHNLKVWTSFASDYNQTNDTTLFQVTSRYHPAAPANITSNVNYATRATLTPVTGVNSWSVYGASGAPQRKSTIYWYRDSADTEPFFEGPTFVTDTNRLDTFFYFNQRRNLPIVRMTQVEIARTGNNLVGLTPSMPYWMAAGRKVAIQFTNVGDATADLSGDTLQTVSPTSSLNNKTYVFPEGTTIEPGQALVVQYVTGSPANPNFTRHTGFAITVDYKSKIAFLYRRGGLIEDVVVLDSAHTNAAAWTNNAVWTNAGVPSYVWSGRGVNNLGAQGGPISAGIFRIAFNGNNSDWLVADDNDPMFLNTINPAWIRYTDNGCEGPKAKATVTLIAPPAADIFLSNVELPEPGCDRGMEDVTVNVRNYGISPVEGLTLHYCAGGDTVTESYTNTISANGYLSYTFNTQLNLAFPNDSVVTVKVWADAVSGDVVHGNDTCSATTISYYTPAAPAPIATRTIDYATRDTVTHIPADGLIPVWYDTEMNPVDTGFTHISDILYVGGTFGMSYLVTTPLVGSIGTATTVNGKTAFPAPYQPNKKHAKQQFIYSASELRAAGLQEGYLSAISFNLDSIHGNRDSISFDGYTIAIGFTADTEFASTTSWKNATQVYQRTPMTIYASQSHGWVHHQFDAPIYWDGVSSVVVQLTHQLTAAITSGVQATYTAKPNTTLFKNGDNALSPSTAEYVGTGTKGNNRPNIRFDVSAYGCSSTITPYEVQLQNIPPVDAAIFWPAGVDTMDYNSCGNLQLDVNLRNQGSTDITGAKLYFYLDNESVDSTVVASTVTPGQTVSNVLVNRYMAPGRHHITAIVSATGDNISSNDTISRAFVVRFCGGSYTIAATGGDYQTFGEAIDTLNVVGIEGAVVFNVAPGTYTEQVVLNNIPGSDATNTVSFVGTGDEVLLTASTSQAASYVIYLDSASNVTLSNFRIEARPTANNVNYANALVMRKGENVNINGCTIRVKGTINNASANPVVLQGDMRHLNITGCFIDSGYVSIKSTGTTFGYENINISNNVIRNFWSQGINLRGVTDITVNANHIQSGVTVDNRGLTGVYLAQTAGSFSLQKNSIYLIDDKKGGKRGVQLESINCTALDPGYVVNNMISCSGTNTTGLTPAKPSGIWIDSSSSNVNVFFNSVRVYCGPNTNATFSENSYGLFTGATVSGIQVMNNIFSNYSKGYALFVSELNTVTSCNYNAYYSVSTGPLGWKNTLLPDLATLQNTNSDDANSLFTEPYFVSDSNLRTVMTNFVGLGQSLADVIDDIDGNSRPQVPGPTIGAYEMPRSTHDMAVVRIIKPVMPENLNTPNNIESDSVCVVAQFYNNGRSTETNVTWYAYVEGYESTIFTSPRNIGTFAPSQMKTDSVMMPTPLGVNGEHIIHVVVNLPSDNSPEDNNRAQSFYLAPAFNVAASRMAVVGTNGCDRKNSEITITIQNVGFKDFPVGTPFTIGYVPSVNTPAGLTIPTMPGVVEETTYLDAPLLTNQSTTISFNTRANLYPTDTAIDIKVRIRGWVKYQYDINPDNDSTNATQASQSPIIDCFYIPDAPIGFDTTFAYGTWGEVRAMQVNSRPIRWYRDSTASPYYSPSQYNASTKWSNTPQYFHDSTYYLNCISTKNCASSFSAVNVHVASLHQNDVAFVEVLAPLGDRVYMENDTVRVRIANYGQRSQTSIPITYILRKGNTVVQEVTETCPVTLTSMQTYDYTFDSLLNITTPTTQQNYSLTIYTDLSNDGVRRNDTIRYAYSFKSLPESLYAPQKPSDPSFDITRVSFNAINLDLPPMGRGLNELATYSNPDYPVLHVTRGLTDSIFIEVAQLDVDAQASRLRPYVCIDFNRNGVFDITDEFVVADTSFYTDRVFAVPITIAPDASYGYMRMRVAVGAYVDFSDGDRPQSGIPSDKDGHNIDFLLFVDETPVTTDLAITQIASPRSSLVRDDSPLDVSFRIANKGATAISNPDINYTFAFSDGSAPVTGTVTYPGTLQPGTSAHLTIPTQVIPFGTTTLTLLHSTPDDTVTSNDKLIQEYHRFYRLQVPFYDDFAGPDQWYAPTGNNEFTRNYWQRGLPHKQRLSTANGDSSAWVTDTMSTIVTGRRGNVSYLYSPIFNISQVRPDTIFLYLRRNLTNGSSLHVEFYNFLRHWTKLDSDSLTTWYNNDDDRVFDGNTSGNDYVQYVFTSSTISGDYNEELQFRLVYTTPMGATATAAYGEGCAVDDFRIARAQARYDAGVVAITKPTEPRYGQTIYPEVRVKNLGYDTITTMRIGYTHYGTNLPKESVIPCHLAPDSIGTFQFTTPFVVTSDFPDTFYINAYTFVELDTYYDNDSLTKAFALSPLDFDVSAHEFVYPLDHVVAGDSTQVTLRIRNFGMVPIENARVSYTVNGLNSVEEEIDFVELMGRPLESREYFNYTFHEKVRASMGMMKFVGVVKADSNDYIYNDTVTKRIQGITSVTDIAAAAMIVDTGWNQYRFQLVIENRGARGANNFEVGFYIDDDTTQIWREIYSHNMPLAALHTGYHYFDVVLPERAGGYPNITSFVHIDGDNDLSNDTTKAFASRFFDLEIVKIIVEENAAPDCRVYAVLRNNGNLTVSGKMLQLKANINDNTLNLNTDAYTYIGGDSLRIPFTSRIPKDPSRHYTGYGTINIAGDAVAQNNMTTVVEVWNYVRIPQVDQSQFVLDQNFPNPFSNTTTVPFTLPEAGNMRLFVIDAMGHIVYTQEQFCPAGQQSITLDLDHLRAGFYYYGIEFNGERRMRKMIMR